MFSIETLMVLIPALPLAAALVVAATGKWLLGERSHIPVVVALGGSFLLSLLLLFQVASDSAHLAPAHHEGHQAAAQPDLPQPTGYERTVTLWTWELVPKALAIGESQRDFSVDIVLRADPLTSIMLSMVLFVSTLVAIYASGYMHGDVGYWRFFAYVALFVFSMTMLVSVSNFALLYVFWEAVGVCSYLLIGFWFQKPEAAAAGKKAFLVNRVGDFGFALGVFLLWVAYGTLNFHDTLGPDGEVLMPGVLGQVRLSGVLPFVAGGTGLAIALLLFVGACGKSAQFPLHVWLPDAMEGPTPVSALIHAATMVTAGVYMVARCTPLFLVAPEAQYTVAAIGAATALLAGLIALTQFDLKRVLAYSTVSQLGYMFLGLGTGALAGITSGMFHLFTHAFFKALLFLGAGSVMHAMGGVIDMRRFGGLRRLMPWTHRTFWFGALALAGVFPFAGFWSKDAIMAAVHQNAFGDGHAAAHPAAGLFEVLYWVGLFTALLTAFYTFRALFLTFYGPERVPPEAGHHAHESPAPMTVPLVILAGCALLVGVVFELTHTFAGFLHRTPSLAYRPLVEAAAHAGHGNHLAVAITSTIVALMGVGLAAFLYLGDRKEVEWLARWLQSPYGLYLYYLSYGKFYFDEIYAALIVLPLRGLALVSYAVDRGVVDGLVNLCGWIPRWIGSALRPLQGGLVPFYALAMVLGLILLLGAAMLWPMA